MLLQCPRCARTTEIHSSPGASLLCPHCRGAYLQQRGSQSGSYAGSYPSTPSRTTPNPDKSQLQAAIEQAYQQDPLTTYDKNVTLERLEELGKGGMGTVYRVKDKRLGREAALKVLSEKATKHSVERFLREAKITARLSHPCIPPVYDAGLTPEGHPYMLMKVIEGETLQAKIQQFHKEPFHKDAVKALLEALIKVCEAASYAHKNGVIHRDLKPENIMVGEFGEVLVMDWGIARDIHTQREATELLELAVINESDAQKQGGLTLAGSVLGTPGYMSPEQASGDKVHPRTDIYALGAILTEILTGKLPVTGDTHLNVIVKTVEGQIKLPHDYNPKVPPELNSIAAQALQLDPKNRIPTALKFASYLRAYLNQDPIPIHSYSMSDRLFRWVQKRPVKALGSAAILFIILLAGFLVQTIVSARREKDILDQRLRLETAAKEKESQERKDAQARATLARKKTETIAGLRSKARQGRPAKELRACIDDALKLGKNDEEFLVNLARVFEEQELVNDSRRILEFAAENNEPAYKALYDLHALELKSQRRLTFQMTSALRRLIARAEKRNEKNVYTEFVKGIRAQKNGDDESALNDFNEAEKLNPYFYWIYIRRAGIYRKRSQIEKALIEYKIAIQTNPLNALAYNNRGTFYLDRRQHQEALEDFNRAIALAPQFAIAYYNRALLRIRLQDKPGALQDLKRTSNLRPDYAQQVNKLKAQLIQKIDNPTTANSFNRRGFQHMNARQFQRAIRDFNSALKLNPKHAAAYNNRGMCRYQIGRFREALSDYNQSIRLKPLALTYNNRGYLYMDRKQYQSALQDFDKAIQIDSQCGQAYNNRGLTYSHLGQHKKAILDYNKSLLINPTLASTYYNRALSKQRIGDNKGAIKDLEQLLQLRPHDKDAESWKNSIRNLRRPQ